MKDDSHASGLGHSNKSVVIIIFIEVFQRFLDSEKDCITVHCLFLKRQRKALKCKFILTALWNQFCFVKTKPAAASYCPKLSTFGGQYMHISGLILFVSKVNIIMNVSLNAK